MSVLERSSVCAETVRRALHQMDYHGRLPGRKKLTSSQKSARLAFVEKHRSDNWVKPGRSMRRTSTSTGTPIGAGYRCLQKKACSDPNSHLTKRKYLLVFALPLIATESQ